MPRPYAAPPVAVLFVLGATAGCPHRETPRTGPSEAGPVAAASTSATPAAPKAPPTGACSPELKRGVGLPDSAHATNIRIAARGTKALVTYWEHEKRGEGPPLDTAFGYVFDAASASLGSKITFERNDVGDEPVSEAVPIALGDDLVAISCAWAAPVGKYDCARAKPGGRSTKLIAFSGIGSGGPDRSDIAAVARGDDALVVVTASRGVTLLSTRVSGKKKDSPFGSGPHGFEGDALTATLSADDEATVVYRQGTMVRARRAGFDETWHGPQITLSAPGTLVGAPAIASEPGRVVALFSQRAKTSDPWRVMLAELSTTGDVKRTELAPGTEPTEPSQGPGVTTASEQGCFHVSWVEGTGKTTQTKLARVCRGPIIPTSITTLSSDGVEGGRAYLASDDATPGALFAVWQEIPPGKPAELRVARLACR